MPIDVLIDHHRQLVLVTAYGEIEYSDLLSCQRDAVSLSTGTGYNALADLSEVDRMPQLSADQISQLAALFLRNDPSRPTPPRLAMVADSDEVYRMARTFEACCNENGNRARVAVFHTLPAAAVFLNISSDLVPKHWDQNPPE